MTKRKKMKSIPALVRGECACYRKGQCSLNEKRCLFFTPGARADSKGVPICDYFMECALPAHWDMDDLIDYALWYDAPDQ